MMENSSNRIIEMFNRISRWYDFLNHLLSAGFDISWRKRAIKKLFLFSQDGIFLDLATGTGDMVVEMKKQKPEAKILALDPAIRMLEVAQQKFKRKGIDNVTLILGKGEDIPAKNQSISGISIAFGIRNVSERKKALSEMARVLKKGGILVILEFSKPHGLFGKVYDFYFKKILPFLGAIFSKNRSAYIYLPESVEKFPEPTKFAEEILSAGFKKVIIEPFTKGICICYIAFKED